MLEHYPLKTYQYLCARLGDVTPVHTELAYYTDNGDAYPLNAEIPFAHQSSRMSCPNALKCGVSWLNADGVLQEAWHLCPALATLRECQTLPESHHHDSPDIPSEGDAQQIVGRERRGRISHHDSSGNA